MSESTTEANYGKLGKECCVTRNSKPLLIENTYQAWKLEAEETTESKTNRVSALVEFKSW